MTRLSLNTRKATLVILASTIGLFFGRLSVEAQQLSNANPPVQRTVRDAVSDLTQQLAAMSFTKITLTAENDKITGTAMKDGRQWHIILDEKGQMHIE